MPLLTLHLLRLNVFTSVGVFLQELQAEQSIEVVIASRPRHMILRPTTDSLPLSKRYELLLLLRTPNAAIPSSLRSHIWYEYKVNVGVPTRVLSTYPERNAKLVNEAADVELTGALDQKRDELTDDLRDFMDKLTKSYGDKPITMLNLLRFNRPNGKKSYQQYGQAFVPVARKRGGEAKIVGNVVHDPSNGYVDPGAPAEGSKDGEWWDEVSLVHYPSIRAFCDMHVGEDYQEVNRKYRMDALRDTMLVCTTEVGLDSERRKTESKI